MSLDIITRAEWGARSFARTPTANYITKTGIVFVHQSEGHFAYGAGASKQQEINLLKMIEAYHMDEHGWSAIGYSYLVFPSGRVYEGRGFQRVTAAQESANFGNGAICFIGDFSRDHSTWAARRSCIQLARLFPGRYMGAHRDVTDTDCPGTNLNAQVSRMALLAGKRRFRRS